jgi:hypothetical protein
MLLEWTEKTSSFTRKCEKPEKPLIQNQINQ